MNENIYIYKDNKKKRKEKKKKKKKDYLIKRNLHINLNDIFNNNMEHSKEKNSTIFGHSEEVTEVHLKREERKLLEIVKKKKKKKKKIKIFHSHKNSKKKQQQTVCLSAE